MRRTIIVLTISGFVIIGAILFHHLYENNNQEIFSYDNDEISSYFPLIENSNYRYIGYYSGKEDTSHLQIKKINMNDGCSIYYFVDNKNDPKHTIIGSSMFGLGIYLFENDQLYTIQAFWDFDIIKSNCSEKQLLISKNIISDNNEVEYSEHIYDTNYKLTFEGKEKIKVPAGEFNDCLKFKIITKYRTEESYIEYFWLAKNIGMVKWQRPTGKIEKLFNYNIAGAK